MWHFMRRFPYGCTTDKHQLYSVFMGKLSQCIFKWDESDHNLLKAAKRAEMIQQGIPNPSDEDVSRRLSTSELALHCKRVTRGRAETTTLIASLLESLEGSSGCDLQGVPLFDGEKMKQIWMIQSQHVGCIQDPPGLQLYRQVDTLKKGGIVLPVYRCARGSTSLESFHLHMNRFIPGKSKVFYSLVLILTFQCSYYVQSLISNTCSIIHFIIYSRNAGKRHQFPGVPT